MIYLTTASQVLLRPMRLWNGLEAQRARAKRVPYTGTSNAEGNHLQQRPFQLGQRESRVRSSRCEQGKV